MTRNTLVTDQGRATSSARRHPPGLVSGETAGSVDVLTRFLSSE